MKLAVKFYKDVANRPEGMPLDWPAEVRELADSDPMPEGPWLQMTPQEYADYRIANMAAWNAYEEAFDPKGRTPEEIGTVQTESSIWQRVWRWLTGG